VIPRADARLLRGSRREGGGHHLDGADVTRYALRPRNPTRIADSRTSCARDLIDEHTARSRRPGRDKTAVVGERTEQQRACSLVIPRSG